MRAIDAIAHDAALLLVLAAEGKILVKENNDY